MCSEICVRAQLTLAVADTVGDSRLNVGGVASADSVGAVTDTVAVVDLAAEAGCLSAGAAEGFSEGVHVVDAGLLLCGQ